jgi:ubiquitin carboxyl-terminal hydrolase L3
MEHRKHFIPLESNPVLFTELIHRLGVSEALSFHDVLSLEDDELLALIPRPALAFVLVFPAAEPQHTNRVKDEEQMRADYEQSGDAEVVVWYKQTIHNACGLYGILHAVSNGEARKSIGA